MGMKFPLIFSFVILLAVFATGTPADACPDGYAQCGNLCCPKEGP